MNCHQWHSKLWEKTSSAKGKVIKMTADVKGKTNAYDLLLSKVPSEIQTII